MVWVRLMDDDPGKAREVAERIRLVLAAYPDLVQVGDMSEYPNKRGPGARISFDVSLSQLAGPAEPREREWVDAERVDVTPPARLRSLPRRELPPGRR